jgi:hypothetical protein
MIDEEDFLEEDEPLTREELIKQAIEAAKAAGTYYQGDPNGQ